MSTLFSILELSRRGLQTQQSALQTSQQNIANANTPGFHRQSAIISTTPGFITGGISTLGRVIQLGTGTAVSRVQRLRDVFVETQIIEVDQRLNRLDEEQKGLERMEIVFNELSETVDLNNTLSEFWASWESLAQDPTNGGLRIDLRAKGAGLAADIRALYASVADLQPDFGEDISIRVDRVNSLLHQLAGLHGDIVRVEGGMLEANDLRDLRDGIVGELSSLIDVKPFENPDGTVTLFLNSRPVVQQFDVTELRVIPKIDAATQNGVPSPSESLVKVVLAEPGRDIDVRISEGAIGGLLRLQDEIVPAILGDLDLFAFTLMRQVNQVHQKGIGLNGAAGGSFFQFRLPDADGTISDGTTDLSLVSNQPPSRASATMDLTNDIKDNLNNIAAALSSARGDNRNALEIARLRDQSFLLEDSLTIDNFYNLAIASLGGRGEETARLLEGTQLVRNQLETRRESVSGVSLDEELTNIIQFQHVFEAAARVVTTVDSMVDTVVNRMGLVGR